MLEGSFVADDKFPDVVAALEARGWRRQHAHFPRPQLRWANYARVPWARVAATQIVSHLQHAVVFSQKAELARRLRAYQRRLQQHGGKTDVVDAFYPRTVELGGERAWRELARWAAYSRALTAVGRYARSLQEGEDTAPPGLGMLRCSITFLEAALRDESFFLQGDEECQVDADAEEWSMLTASRTGGAAAASTDELFPLTTIENAGVMDLLQRVRARDPQFLAVRDDGEGEGEGDSVWICKPSNLSQGRGITLIRNLSELTDLLNTPSSEKANTQQQWIVQKYIERPLLLQGGRKFDIRQWVLITALSPDARVYWYRDCYLRFCAQPFSLNAESCRDRYAHLTNYSVQKDFVSGVTSHREVACEDGGSPGITSAFESMWCSNQASDVLRYGTKHQLTSHLSLTRVLSSDSNMDEMCGMGKLSPRCKT